MVRRGEGSMRGFKIEDREDTGMGGEVNLYRSSQEVEKEVFG